MREPGMSWLLVTIVLAASLAVLLGMLAEGANARSRARGH